MLYASSEKAALTDAVGWIGLSHVSVFEHDGHGTEPQISSDDGGGRMLICELDCPADRNISTQHSCTPIRLSAFGDTKRLTICQYHIRHRGHVEHLSVLVQCRASRPKSTGRPGVAGLIGGISDLSA
jgi:hypothetical protein